LMDLIIDFLTYVFIPAFALFTSGLLAGWTGWFAIIIISYGSVIYFSDTRMKTLDKSFSGFPACWNMVVLVLFATSPPPSVILFVVSALTVGMFLPLKFVHPTRTKRWFWATLPISIVWIICAGWSAWVDFGAGPVMHWVLALASIYLCTAGIAQQTFPERKPMIR
jgi:phosphatidylcholine synthase